MKLTDKKLYEDNSELYDILSDYVHELKVPVEQTTPTVMLEVNLDDCILNEEGLFVPHSYVWKYKGSSEIDDPDEYSPMYNADVNEAPNMAQDKILALLHPELAGKQDLSNTNEPH